MDRDQLEHNQIPIYFAAVVAAVIIGLSAPSFSEQLGAWVTPAIAVLMYAMFLQIPFLDLREGLANKRFIFALLLSNFVLVPLLVWALTRGLTSHPAILIGALLVLLTPCIDYVVVFTHIGKGDSKLMLAATPLLLLLQLALLPIYLALLVGADSFITISITPFVEAFLFLIVAPMGLAVLSAAGAKKVAIFKLWTGFWGWMPVPAMAAVLIVVIASQISFVVNEIENLLPVIPVYLAFMILAPLLGAFAAWLLKLPATNARAVAFSSGTRNSLVILPLALALPAELRGLAAAAVLTQTLIELVSELIYVRLIPTLIWRK